MKATAFCILCVFLVILSVQARPVESNEKKQLSFEQYLKRLISQAELSTDDNGGLSVNTEDVTPMLKRGFLFFPDRRSTKRHYRPMYSYGRKAHWDTFFG